MRPVVKLSVLLLVTLPAVTVLTGVSAQDRSRTAASAAKVPTGNIEHGRYLVEDVAQCPQCHSPRDKDGTIIDDRRFMGAPIIPCQPPWPHDWAIEAPRNRGLPGYTVEQGLRLLTQGAIARDGRQLKPPMPRFHMTPQDAADVVAYLKSLETTAP
jgi:mono/diheme cytochrome c family protein